jgi:hypothetical protein
VWLAIMAAVIAPTILSYGTYSMAWDDLYFFHRTVSLNRAIWSLDGRQFVETFSILMKSPVMALMAAPWGPAGTSEKVIGLSLVSLAGCTWLVALVCIYLMARMGCGKILLVVAGASLAANPVLTGYAGAFLVDGLLSWVVLLTLLLGPYEALTEEHGVAASIRRGLLWALALNAGALAKVTYGYFALLMVPCLLLIRWRRGGATATIVAAASCVGGCLPSIVIWGLFGAQFLRHAQMSAWGAGSRFYAAPGISPLAFAGSYIQAIGAAFYLHCGLGLAAIWMVARKRVRVLRAAIWPLLVLALYFLLSIQGSNRDLRFFMPAMVSFPFLLVALVPNGPQQGRPAVSKAAFAAAFLVMVLVSLPMTKRPELSNVWRARDLLVKCGLHGYTRITLATDSPGFNIETFLLAKELLGKPGRKFRIGTLVYDIVHEKPVESGFEVMRHSDVTIFEEPQPVSPEFTNRRAGDYGSYVLRNGRKVTELSDQRTSVFEVIRRPG